MQHTSAYAVAKSYDDEDLLRRLYDAAEQEATREVLRALRRTREEFAADLVRLTTLGDYVGVAALAETIAARIGDAITSEYERAYLSAARSATRGLSNGLRLQVSFSGSNPRAAEHLRRHAAQLISEINVTQREAIQAALNDGLARGINPRKVADEIRRTIGLTARQQRAVSNYRRLLESGSRESLDRALRDPRFDARVRGGTLDSKTIDRMVNTYRTNYIRYRSEVIARSEMLRATSEGAFEAYTQAIESGALSRHDYVRQWRTARDERVRGSHRSMHGQVRRFGQPFRSGAGNKLRYPHDPNAPLFETLQCRCLASTRFAPVLAEETAPQVV